MGRIFFALIISMLVFASDLIAQAETWGVQGIVADSLSREPIPYATVVLRVAESDDILDATTTDLDGSFSVGAMVPVDYLEVSFIGYRSKRINLAIVGPFNDIGTIFLSSDAMALDVAEVQAERSTMEFKLDKRVYNVGADISGSGASATDVLNNVPSVNVDIEGNISLRGSQGVQVLINGKPSVLSDDGATALGAISADMIESVEVITNPSAKYEGEGSSGIINIVLKKEEKKGFNGSVSLNTGYPANHSIGSSLNLRTENFNFFTQFGAGYRSIPTFAESINRNLVEGSEIYSEGTEYRNEQFYNITLGTDYYINDLNVITLSGNYAYEIEEQPSETVFDFFDADGVKISSYRREETTSATNPKYQYDLQYKREFRNNEDHVLLFSTLGSFFGKDLSSEFINTPLLNSEADPNQLTETDFYQRDYTYKLDYTNPLSEKFTIETGGMYEINDVANDFAVSNLIDGVWEQDLNFTNNFEFLQKVLGVYGTGAYQGSKWGLKLGLRAEQTDLSTVLTTTNEINNQEYLSYFPSAHTSYKINDTYSLQAGYSRRITRPRLWDLNPFFNIRNQYNIRRGNPQLLPEFADSYEITGIFLFEKFSFNTSIYHLYTTSVIERISFFEENVSITQPENIGTRAQTGFELNGKYTPLQWLSMNGDFNYGFFNRRGSFGDQVFDFNGDQWTFRLTSRFKFPKDIELEASADYQSGFETVQGRQSGFIFMDAGLRKKFWKGKGVLNLGVRDLFASRIRESFAQQNDFYFYNFSQRGRFLTLGFSYSFGKGEAMSYSGRYH